MAHRGLQARMVVAMSILFGFYVLVAALFAPVVGIPVVIAGSVLFVGVQYVVGKKLALRSVDATDLDPDVHPEIHDRVETLAESMEIDKPRLMAGRMGVPNAFAIGRKGAGTVVVSDSMLRMVKEGHMSMDELEGVLAHELAHIKNRDVIVMLLGQSVASIIGLTVFFVVQLVTDDIPIVGFIVAYLLSIVTQMLVMVFVLAISRYREYVADEEAAEHTGNPDALARALAVIQEVGTHEEAPEVDGATASMCIFGGERGLLAAVFSTHPPTEKRINRLTEMAD
ncbi:M48 family metalloprotease [Natronomonas sp.]|uniref:M48 family metalloprotease n=1 Tax=Natronomonas sp. TaxID=2184060 RepID=UPI002FC2C854